jgi:hypothetical protein
MSIPWTAILIAIIGTSLYLARDPASGVFPIRPRLLVMPALDRVSLAFFVAALMLVALDQLYWAFYWQTPNYLSVIAALGALEGLIYTISSQPAVAVSPPDGAAARSSERWSVFAAFVAFLAFYSVTGSIERSPYDAHVRQALSFLHLHTDIERSPGIEQVVFAGRYFQLHPPLPAFLLMPFVAIWGMDTNQTAFSLVAGSIDAALAWWLLGRLRLSVSARVWLTLFFGAGTVMWFETLNGGSWDVSQIVAVGFTLAALGEVFGDARPGVIGLLAGLSALARNDLALDFPIFVGLYYVQKRNWREMLWFGPGFALAGVIYVALNEARFHSVFDLGQFLYTPNIPTFAMAFLPQNLDTLLFMQPKINIRFPYIHPSPSGQALTFTSPAFVLALRASLANVTPLLLLIGALLAMGPSLFFNNNGGAQFGTRHYIHSFPFLLVLMAKGLPGYVDQLTKILILASVGFIGLGVFHLRLWGFG